MLWRLTNPNFPGCVETPATSTPFGSKSASNPWRTVTGAPFGWRGAGPATSWRGTTVSPEPRSARSCRHLDEGVDGDGLPVDDDERVQVRRHDRPIRLRRCRQANQHIDQRFAVH